MTILTQRKKTAALLFLTVLFLTAFLSGCGKKDPALENYKANMTQFFENMKVFDSSINSIDPNSDTAPAQLLALLDNMNTSFEQMASLEVPDDFPGVAELATQASENMSQAVYYYHQAFDGDTYNANMADAAKQYYDRANLRVQYIISILHGNIPEEIYSYDEETTSDTSQETAPSDPSTEESSSDDNFDTDDTVFYDDESSGEDVSEE